MNALCAIRTVYGAGLLLAPRTVLTALARTELDGVSIAVARLLGARQLAQAALAWAVPTRRCRLAGVGVDAAHAASMIAAARLCPAPLHRRLAARDARTATLLALAGVVVCNPRSPALGT